MPLIKWRVATLISNILAQDSQDTSDILDPYEREAFCQGGDLLVTVKLWRTLEVAQFFTLIPFKRLGKDQQKSFHFGLWV